MSPFTIELFDDFFSSWFVFWIFVNMKSESFATSYCMYVINYESEGPIAQDLVIRTLEQVNSYTIGCY